MRQRGEDQTDSGYARTQGRVWLIASTVSLSVRLVPMPAAPSQIALAGACHQHLEANREPSEPDRRDIAHQGDSGDNQRSIQRKDQKLVRRWSAERTQVNRPCQGFRTNTEAITPIQIPVGQ